MTTPTTTRTPQQASIEASEAREAWEAGSQVDWSHDKHRWQTYEGKRPKFNHVDLYWRISLFDQKFVAKPTPPIIGPGKWRTRDGKIVEVTGRSPTTHVLTWVGANGGAWYEDGLGYKDGREHPTDLLTRVETRWRAWKPEEVPLGREVRSKNNHKRRELIYETCCYDYAFANYELLLPDGTYAPCGVEEVIG